GKKSAHLPLCSLCLGGQLPSHFHHAIFDGIRKWHRQRAPEDRARAFVSAAGELALEVHRIIDHGLSADRNQQELLADADDLDGAGVAEIEFVAALDRIEQELGLGSSRLIVTAAV